MDHSVFVKILLSLMQFGMLTGSELYVYELARELLELGHTVGIASMATDLNSDLVKRLQHPHLKYYQLSDIKDEWDVAHCSQTNVTEMVRLVVTCPIVQTVHSEVLDKFESPVDDIAHYIAVRPKIYENLANKYKPDQISLIYNGVDPKRFYPRNGGGKAIVFPGTVNYLRKPAFQDVAKYMEDGYKIIYIGNGWKEREMGNTMFLPPVWNIEEVYARGSMTASIMLGRTTIEGWMMGLPGLIYDIDDTGKILSKKVFDVPKNTDQYRSDFMAKAIVKIYERVLK